MIDAVFGRDLSRTFIAYENNEPCSIQQLLSVSLFSSIPSLSDAQSATGALISQGFGFAGQSVNPFAVTYTLPATADPSPGSFRQAWQYWEAINFRLTSGAQIQTEFRGVVFERAVGGDVVPQTTASDAEGIFPAIQAYVTEAQINQFITNALEQMQIDMEGSGVEWAQARQLKKYKLTLGYLVVAMASESQITGKNGEAHAARATMFRKMYDGNMKKIKLPYDSIKSGEATETKNGSTAFWSVPR